MGKRSEWVWTTLAIIAVVIACAGIVLAPMTGARVHAQAAVAAGAGQYMYEGGTWPPVGQMAGGRPYDVAVEGGYAYVAARSALTVVDVSMPSAPRQVGYWAMPDTAYGVAVSGGYAYVADYGCGLRVVDVADPAHPVEVGFWDGDGVVAPRCYDVEVANGYAYVADYDTSNYYGGLVVIDVSNPAHPVKVPGPFALGAHPRAITIAGQRAYLAPYGGGLRIMDISNPASPVELGMCGSYASLSVAVSGAHAYLADLNGKLRAINVANPANPFEDGVSAALSMPSGVAVSGGYAYVADYNALHVLHMYTYDPDSLTEVGAQTLPTQGYRLAVEGEYAYVCDDTAGLRIVDVSDPAHPVEVGYCDTLGGARDMVTCGSYLYTAGIGGLRTVNVSDAVHPAATSYQDPAGWDACCLDGCGMYLYVGYDTLDGLTQTPLLRVMSLADPAHPVQVGSCSLTLVPRYALAVSGGYAYVCNSGLAVIDVSSPASPVQVAQVGANLSGTRYMAILGQTAYVTGTSTIGGMYPVHMIDISNPTSPAYLGYIPMPARPYGINASGGRVYVCDSTGVRSLDSSIYWPTPGIAYAVAVAGNHAYVADDMAGLRILDITDPMSPAEVAFWNTPGWARDVATSGAYVYVADYSWGLLTFCEYGKVVSAPHMKGCPGSTFSVPISLNDGSGVGAAQIDLRYDPDIVTALSVEKGDLVTADSHWQLLSQLDAGRAQAVLYNDQGTELGEGGGALVNVTFQVNPATTPGSSTVLELRKAILSDAVGNGVPCQASNGSIEVVVVDHFVIDHISSPQGGDPANPLPFAVTVRAIDQYGELVTTYTGSLTLSDLTGTVQPTEAGPFVAGLGYWTHDVTIGAPQGADVLQVDDGAGHTAQSNAFDVIAPGSVDGDQEINVLDVMKVVNIILGQLQPTPWQIWAADMNQDQVVNVQDIILIINEIFAQPGSMGASAKAGEAMTSTAAAGAGPITVGAAWSTSKSGNPVLAITLSNGAGVAGAQCDVSYNAKRVRSIAVRPGGLLAAASGWNVQGNTVGAGAYRVLGYSATAQGLAGGKGSLVELEFTASGKGNLAELAQITLTDGAGNRVPARLAVR